MCRLTNQTAQEFHTGERAISANGYATILIQLQNNADYILFQACSIYIFLENLIHNSKLYTWINCTIAYASYTKTKMGYASLYNNII